MELAQMRFLTGVIGLLGVVGAASASAPDDGLEGYDAAAGQVVYEMRFGGGATPSATSFQLRLGNEHQLLARQPVPFSAEYRPQTGGLLVNGLDVSPLFINHQFEESGAGSTIAGWIPLLIVLSAASFIIIDGNDLTSNNFNFGSGSTGGF